MKLERILVIQTAFLGDVILATPVWENLHKQYPQAQIDVVVKKGNESLLAAHPFLNQVFIFDKSQKVKNLWSLGKTLRAHQYDLCRSDDLSLNQKNRQPKRHGNALSD